jgi:hypothetical protein
MTAPDPYSINIAELRRIVDALLKRIEAQAGPEVIIDDEHYWDLPSPEVWDMATKPTEVDQVGSLADDLHFLRVMTDPLNVGPTLNLIHVAPLLRYLGEKVAV